MTTATDSSRACAKLRFALWALPGWIGMLSLLIEQLTVSDYEGWLWHASSRGMFVILLTPISFILLAIEWRRARGFTVGDQVLFALLAAPTLVAALGALALAFQTFIGVPM